MMPCAVAYPKSWHFFVAIVLLPWFALRRLIVGACVVCLIACGTPDHDPQVDAGAPLVPVPIEDVCHTVCENLFDNAQGTVYMACFDACIPDLEVLIGSYRCLP